MIFSLDQRDWIQYFLFLIIKNTTIDFQFNNIEIIIVRFRPPQIALYKLGN